MRARAWERAGAWSLAVLLACKSTGGPEETKPSDPPKEETSRAPDRSVSPSPDPSPSPSPSPDPDPAPDPSPDPAPNPSPNPAPSPNPDPSAEQDPSPILDLADPPPPGPDPKDPRRACKKDADCELLPQRPCTCTPCGATWREAVNTQTAKDLQDRWARRRCKAPMCPQCVGRYLGETAVCESGSCVPR